MRLRLLERFFDRAHLAPDAPALSESAPAGDPPQVICYSELAGAAAGLSHRIAAVVPPGGVVLISLPNQPAFTASFLGALSAGVRAFLISPEVSPAEMTAAARNCGAVLAITTDAVADALRDVVPGRIPINEVLSQQAVAPADRTPDAGGLLLQSSGTTGQPKIVFRDAVSLDAVAEAMAEAIGFRADDRVLGAVPLCHSYGIEHGLLAPIWAGSCVHLCRGFDLRAVRRELASGGVTIMPGVPFMFDMLASLGDGSTFPTLRRTYSAGGPLPRAIYDAFAARYGVHVSQLYGATEIGSVTYADPDVPGFDPASVGRPMKGVTVRIVDATEPRLDHPLPPGQTGQVAVATASMLRGYLNSESNATVDGFFLTGDLGRIDDHGNLLITGRLKLLIDIGGLKVNPVEVEDVLMQHPGVDACVVMSIRVSETVNRLKAIVTPSVALPDAQLSADVLRQFARSRLTSYKVPRIFEIRDSLPKSPTGKILRHLVEAG